MGLFDFFAKLSGSLTLHDLLKKMIAENAAELHIAPDTPPAFIQAGKPASTGTPPLSPDQARTLCLNILTDHQRETLEHAGSIEFSFGVKGIGRFTAHLTQQDGKIRGVVKPLL